MFINLSSMMCSSNKYTDHTHILLQLQAIRKSNCKLYCIMEIERLISTWFSFSSHINSIFTTARNKENILIGFQQKSIIPTVRKSLIHNPEALK